MAYSFFASAAGLLYAIGHWLNEQIHASLLRLSQVGRDPGQLIHTVDQGILGNSHQPHGGGTGDELHAKILRSLN